MTQGVNGQRPKLLHQVFERQAVQRPSVTAVEDPGNGGRLTYKQLDDRANYLASLLVNQGVKPGEIVGIYLHRGIEQYIAILAILKAGAAYLPIDSELPKERIVFMLRNSGILTLLTQDQLWSEDYANLSRPVFLDSVFENFELSAHDRCAITPVTTTEESLCYVIYTSGTTGTPKGVCISHGNALTFVTALMEVYGVNAEDRVFQGFSTSFDASVEEIWLAFSVGATLVLGTLEQLRNVDELPERLHEFKISVFSTIPSLLRVIPKRELPYLRLLIIGGEPAHHDVIKKWSQTGRKILNGYGPTECTVTATYAWCSPESPITIGKPLPGYGAIVVDENLTEVPDGKEGELCIFGSALSLTGYLNLPSLTEEKFFSRNGNRFYRTGDLAFRNGDGNLVYCGRIDSQVKFRGFRVELTEVESQINRLDNFDEAIVALQEDDTGSQRLVAYVLQSEPTPVNVRQALSVLRRHLPEYMIPGLFVSLKPSAVPRLTSGKIDRNRLPPPSTCVLLGYEALNGEKEKANTESIEHTPLARKILCIWQEIFQKPVEVEDSFFELGGHSLLAAQVISRFRQDPQLARLSIRDLYEHKNILGLTKRLGETDVDNLAANAKTSSLAASKQNRSLQTERHAEPVSSSCYRLVVFLQSLVLFGLAAGCAYTLYGFFLLEQWFEFLNSTSPWLTFCLVALVVPNTALLLTFLVGLFIKRICVGRFREQDLPLWSIGYFRWWATNLCLLPVNTIIGFLVGTPLAPFLYRLMGANIGKGVYLASPISEADLITIDDGVSIGPSVTLRTHFVEDGLLKLRRIHLGRNVFVGARSVIGGGVCMGDGSRLHPLSCLGPGRVTPPGTEWRGSPARGVKTGELALSQLLQHHEKGFQKNDSWYSWKVGLKIGGLQILFLLVLEVFMAVPLALELLIILSNDRLSAAVYELDLGILAPLSIPFSTLRFSCMLAIIIAAKWLLTGQARAGSVALGSLECVRRWFAGLLMSLFVSPTGTRAIGETVFMPWMCRLLGMRVGKGCEISDALGFQPDLVKLGNYSMLADHCLIGLPVVHFGRMTLGETSIGNYSFVGNVAQVSITTDEVKDRSLIGVRSIAPDFVSEGSSWLGSPPIRLPRRIAVRPRADRTTHPSRRLILARAFCNIWKMVLPGALIEMVLWATFKLAAAISLHAGQMALVLLLPIIMTVSSLTVLMLPILAKWLLIGRYTAGERFLWSFWMWRLEIAYEIEQLVLCIFMPILVGTPYLPLWYRAMGARIGHRVLMIDGSIMEPDLVRIGNHVTLEGVLQTHLFEDRVMKLGPITIQDNCYIGSEACVLHDSEMGENSSLGDLSLIMRGESVPANGRYQGLPAEHAFPPLAEGNFLSSAFPKVHRDAVSARA